MIHFLIAIACRTSNNSMDLSDLLAICSAIAMSASVIDLLALSVGQVSPGTSAGRGRGVSPM